MKKNKFSILNEKLLKQLFPQQNEVAPLQKCQLIAQVYANVENAISVISDLKEDRSFIYPGDIAHDSDLPTEPHEIDSIWEDEVFDKVHPEDMLEKYAIELHFFQLLKKLPVKERTDYKINSLMRIKNKNNEYTIIQHRVHYLYSSENGSILMAFGLFNYPSEPTTNPDFRGSIVNMRTGEIIIPDNQHLENLLTDREKEILQLIKLGKSSKEIAGKLNISLNTVNRHRQNILEKLHVNSAIAACRIAESVKII